MVANEQLHFQFVVLLPFVAATVYIVPTHATTLLGTVDFSCVEKVREIADSILNKLIDTKV